MHYLSRRHPDIQTADSSSIVSNNPLSHDPVTGIFLLESKMQLLTVHELKMKKWDLATGEMAKLIRLMPSQLNQSHTISCCSVSDTKKLLLVGTSRGLVAAISIYSGGLVLKCDVWHDHRVVFVGIYRKMILSLDSRGAIQKYAGFKNSFYGAHHVSNDILSRSKLVHLPTVKLRNTISQCTIARVHAKHGILVVATDTGLLRFFCLTNDKVILSSNALEDEVMALLLKEEECQMYTADKSGNICCWELPEQYPARKMFFATCLWRVQNMDAQNQPLSTFCMQTIGNFVITGDAKGLIKVWEVIVREVPEEEQRRGTVVGQMRLFRLTDIGTFEDYQCKLFLTFPVSNDWLGHLMLITMKDLNRARRPIGLSDDEDESSDESDDDNVICLISASLDGQLSAWKLTGTCLGDLTVNSRRSRKQWNVRVNVEAMEKTRLKHAAKLFSKFEL